MRRPQRTGRIGRHEGAGAAVETLGNKQRRQSGRGRRTTGHRTHAVTAMQLEHRRAMRRHMLHGMSGVMLMMRMLAVRGERRHHRVYCHRMRMPASPRPRLGNGQQADADGEQEA